MQLDGADKWLLLRAMGWLAIARIMLVAMSFERWSARLSETSNSTEVEPDQVLLERIGFAVSAAANNVPWPPKPEMIILVSSMPVRSLYLE